MKLDALPKEIRTADRFVAIHDAREEAAREARGCQTQYKRAMAGFILATALAAILGGFVLYGLDTPPESAADGPYLKQLMSGKAMHVSLAVLQAVSLAIAAFFGYLLNKVKYDEEWLF